MKRGIKEVLLSVMMKVAAILAFLAMNLIGYRAFSQTFQTSTLRPVSQAASEVPACQLAPEGYVANKWKSIRIQVGQAVVAGAQTLAELGSQLQKLIVEKKCFPLPVHCTLASEGLAMGAWVKHRIMIQEQVAIGGDTTARIFDQLGQLKKFGVCQD
jgi:hypothetical protein